MAPTATPRPPSVLGHAILQLLTRSTASGYDLKKRFYSSVGHGWHAYDTQIYRELKALESGGYVTGEVAQGRSGPQRRLYSITEKGTLSLQEWLTSDLDVNKFKDEFSLRVWTADQFPEEGFVEFVTTAKRQWEEALEHQRISLQVLTDQYGDPDGSAPGDVYGRQLAIDYSIHATEAKIHWAERALRVDRYRSRDAVGSARA